MLLRFLASSIKKKSSEFRTMMIYKGAPVIQSKWNVEFYHDHAEVAALLDVETCVHLHVLTDSHKTIVQKTFFLLSSSMGSELELLESVQRADTIPLPSLSPPPFPWKYVFRPPFFQCYLHFFHCYYWSKTLTKFFSH